MHRSLLAALLAGCCSLAPVRALAAQTLEVTLSPFSPPARNYFTESGFTVVLGAFRFEAWGAGIQLEGFVLTHSGNGEFDEDLKDDGVRIWLDDGDGIHDETLDTLLVSADGALPTVPITLPVPIPIQMGAPIDLWIVAYFNSEAGGWYGNFHSVEIASPADVTAPMTTVEFGPDPPKTNEMGLFLARQVYEDWAAFEESQLCSAHSSVALLPGCAAVLALLFVARLRRNYLRGRVRRQYAG
jgi:hypothetical protein